MEYLYADRIPLKCNGLQPTAGTGFEPPMSISCLPARIAADAGEPPASRL
jgi:hypothetical protein